MNVLVTGAAGYIGSHAVQALVRAEHQVVAVDNLSRGHRAALPSAIPFFRLDIRDTNLVLEVLRKYHVDCIMHFAAFAYVGESVEKPLMYYDNNVGGTISLLSAMSKSDCRKLVFSSTCATYGEPVNMPISENTIQNPVNPYGYSKLFSERMILDTCSALPGFSCAILRYFNVAGASADGSVGECHDPETHLIPLIIQTALGQHEKIEIFGDDYTTADGTCVRDYIHVEDLVDAHLMVMQVLEPGYKRVYNIGSGHGFSVKEVLDAVQQITNKHIRVNVRPKRLGDPPELYADASKIMRELGWKANRSDITTIIESAWRWFRNNV